MYFDESFRYSMVSWGVLGCLGVSWGNKTDRDCRADSQCRFEQGTQVLG